MNLDILMSMEMSLLSLKHNKQNVQDVGNSNQQMKTASASVVQRVLMPDFSQPVSFTFIGMSIAILFIFIGIGIVAVQKVKNKL